MALDNLWIESHVNLTRHRRFAHLLELLGDVAEATVVGSLHLLWHGVLEQQPDGDLTEWRPFAIARLARWPGQADTFVDALRASGFLDTEDGHTVIHDWPQYTQGFRKIVAKRQHDHDLAEAKKAARLARADGPEPTPASTPASTPAPALAHVPTHVREDVPAITSARPVDPGPETGDVQDKTEQDIARAREADEFFPDPDPDDDVQQHADDEHESQQQPPPFVAADSDPKRRPASADELAELRRHWTKAFGTEGEPAFRVSWERAMTMRPNSGAEFLNDWLAADCSRWEARKLPPPTQPAIGALVVHAVSDADKYRAMMAEEAVAHEHERQELIRACERQGLPVPDALRKAVAVAS